jgi:hypothetical protein
MGEQQRPPPTRRADGDGYEHRRSGDPGERTRVHERAGDDDWWARLPGVLKILIALAAVWASGASATLFAQRFSEIPAAVEAHGRRITTLEQVSEFERDRTNRNLLFLACRIEDMIEGTDGRRCDLVLDASSRAVLDGLRSPRTPRR